MQQFLQWMRHLLYPAAALFLSWAGYQVLANTYISDSAGKVLVVYNADTALADTSLRPDLADCSKLTPDMENPSEQALLGICQAYLDQRKQQGPRPAIELLNLHESADRSTMDSSGPLNAGKVYEQLSAKLAHGSILGVISLLTSPESQPVVRFCRGMQIPLLLALAANNDLLSPAEDTNGIVFRITPTNGEQALDIANWTRARQFRRVAIFHEPNSFGEYLFRQVNANLRGADAPLVYQFEVREHMEFADIMPELWCDDIDALVYLGFASRAMDLINKLKWYQADPSTTRCIRTEPVRGRARSFAGLTVLLSSAAYDKDLNDNNKFRFPFELFAMLPTNPVQPRSTGETQREEIPYLTEYGYDAYRLMTRLAADGKGKGPGALQATLSSGPEESKTGHVFRFTEQGELVPSEKNKYQVYCLKSSGDGKLDRRVP